MDNAGTVKMKNTLANLLHVFGDNQGSWGGGGHQIVSLGRNFPKTNIMLGTRGWVCRFQR